MCVTALFCGSRMAVAKGRVLTVADTAVGALQTRYCLCKAIANTQAAQ